MKRQLLVFIAAVSMMIAGCNSGGQTVTNPSDTTQASTTATQETTSATSSSATAPSCEETSSLESVAMSLRNYPGAVSIARTITLEPGPQFCQPVTVHAVWYEVTEMDTTSFSVAQIHIAQATYDSSTTQSIEGPSDTLCRTIVVVAYVGDEELGVGELPKLETTTYGGTPFTSMAEATGRVIKAEYYAAQIDPTICPS
ncbi:MAG TPA: hypothetical protein VFZ58_01870 [Candidatus Saccharimonadales bacterium]